MDFSLDMERRVPQPALPGPSGDLGAMESEPIAQTLPNAALPMLTCPMLCSRILT